MAIENEFAPSDTDEKARTQLRLNSLKRYIRRVIAKNSLNRYGKFTRQVVNNLKTLVLRDKISRNIWSNALMVLRSASKIIVIGYSFPATDFYSEWLFRTALKGYRDVKIWIVNPLNDSGKDDGSAFEKRMSIITQHKKVTKYYRFDQINEILSDVRSKA